MIAGLMCFGFHGCRLNKIDSLLVEVGPEVRLFFSSPKRLH